MTNSKLQLSANDNCEGETHTCDSFTLEFDYVGRAGEEIPMLGIPKSSENKHMSPLEALGSNFTKAVYQQGFGDGYDHAKSDAACFADAFVQEFFADDVRMKEIRMKIFAAINDVNDGDVVWVNDCLEVRK